MMFKQNKTIEATLMKKLHDQTIMKKEINELLTSVITLKFAMGAPLTLREQEHYTSLPADQSKAIMKSHMWLQHEILKKAEQQTPATIIKNTTVTSTNKPKAKKHTDKGSNHSSRWTQADDRNLARLVKAGHDNARIAELMGRTPSSIEQRITKHNKR